MERQRAEWILAKSGLERAPEKAGALGLQEGNVCEKTISMVEGARYLDIYLDKEFCTPLHVRTVWQKLVRQRMLQQGFFPIHMD